MTPAWRDLVALSLIGTAAVWLWSSLATLATFALRYPAFDQYRLYAIYLGLPFPANAVQLENGHRPILPALLRLLEIRWFGADQILQTVVGLAAAAASLALIVRTIARECSLDIVTRAAAILLSTLAIFWLGNARVLIHGNESVQMYFVMLFVVLAIFIVAKRREPASIALACACCLSASFSFGTGMASFGAVMLLGAIVRWRWPEWTIVSVAFLASIGVYALGLPGSAGVRHTLFVAPHENVAIVLRWLSAPWMCAWLGNGDAMLPSWGRSAVSQTGLGYAVLASARGIAAMFGEDALLRESLLVGALGVVAFFAAIVHAWRRRAALSSLRFLALGLSAFAFGAAVIVCFARLEAFRMFPGDVFADRYLPWSCLFWLGLALYALGGESRSTWKAPAAAFAAFATAAILLTSQRSQAGWSAAVSRNIQHSAVAAQLGIWDADTLPDDRSSRRDTTIHSLDLLRERGVAEFAEPEFELVSTGWRAPPVLPAPREGGAARIDRTFRDTWGNRNVAAFEGVLPKALPRDPLLAVVGTDGTLRGLAKRSFVTYAAHSLRFDWPKLRGFDGYVIDPHPGETLTILALDRQSHDALAAIPLHVPDDAPTSAP